VFYCTAAKSKPRLWRLAKGLALGCSVALLGACAVAPVAPWEKGHLAKTTMLLDADKLEAGFLDHTYFSKEASAGGRGLGGGGCGCN